MPKFEGLIVGGPMAGKFHADTSRHFNVIEQTPPPSLSAALCCAAMSNVTYIHHSLDIEDETIGFWIPVGGSLKTAMKTLVETYAMHEDLK